MLTPSKQEVRDLILDTIQEVFDASGDTGSLRTAVSAVRQGWRKGQPFEPQSASESNPVALRRTQFEEPLRERYERVLGVARDTNAALFDFFGEYAPGVAHPAVSDFERLRKAYYAARVVLRKEGADV